jgi:hypothetical protein
VFALKQALLTRYEKAEIITIGMILQFPMVQTAYVCGVHKFGCVTAVYLDSLSIE